MLTEDQILAATRAFKTYTQIFYRYNDGFPSSADIDHSALLKRLLSGKEALDKPPPVHFAYPWYDLAEGIECKVYLLIIQGEKVTLEQNGSDWEKVDSFHLRHKPDGDLYKLNRALPDGDFEYDGRNEIGLTITKV